MDDGRSLGSALQPLKPISSHGVMLPRLSFLGNPSLQFLYKRIAYVARHGHGLKVKDMNDQTNYFSLGTQGDQLSSWLQHHMQIPHLHSTPRALANPSRLCPGPGVEAGDVKRVKKSNVDRIISAGEMEECTRLTLMLRRRLSIGQAKFEMALKSLQGSSSLALECEEWPDGAPLDVLRRVHLLLDADDMLLQLFQEASENDSADATIVGTFPAEAASRILKAPDSGWGRSHIGTCLKVAALVPEKR